MKKIIGIGTVLMLVIVTTLSGCVKLGDELQGLIEPVNDCYEIYHVFEIKSIGGTDWSKMKVKMTDNCLGLQETYYCRFNRITKEIIWTPELTNISWVKEIV